MAAAPPATAAPAAAGGVRTAERLEGPAPALPAAAAADVGVKRPLDWASFNSLLTSCGGQWHQGSCVDNAVLILLEVAAIVGRQSHSSFDREFLHQVHGMGGSS